MAARGQELNVKVTATDQASPTIADVSAKLGRLSAEDREVVLQAQVKQAERELDRLTKQLGKIDQLDDDEITVLLEARDRASSKVRDLRGELARLDDAAADVESGFEQAESAGEAMARALNAKADDMIREIDATARAVEAMARELDGVDLDAAEVVAELKRSGLTAEQVEQDVEALAAAMRRVKDIDVHAASKGFSDLGQAVDGVRSNTERANDASRGFYGNVAGDSADALTGVSGLGESVSQLTEGILEGQIGFKQLAVAGLGMGAVAFVFKQVQSAKEAMAKVDAFETDQVEAYTEALADAEDGLTAIAERLRETRKIEFVDLLSGETKDATAAVAALGLSIDEFSQLVESGTSGVERWAQEMRDAGASGESFDQVVLAAYQQAYTYEQAVVAAEVATAVFGKSADEAASSTTTLASATDDATESFVAEAEALRDSAEALQEQLDAKLASVDATYGLRDAEDEFVEALAAANEEIESSGGDLRKMRGAMDDAARAAADVASAQVRVAEETARASGRTLTATQRLDEMNGSLLRSAASASGPLREAILGHIAAVNDIPASRMTGIAAAIDAGDLVGARALLDEVSRSRTVAVKAVADTWEAERKLRALEQERYTPIVPRVQGRTPGRFAQGTKGSPEGWALVGEDGPELINLPRGSQVTNAQQTAAAMSSGGGGGGVTIVNLPKGISPTEVATMLRRYGRVQGPM